MNEIVLASASIGRKKLFQKYFKSFKISVSNINESKIKISNPYDLTKRLCYLKASSIAKFYQDDYVFGFDTIVVCENKIITKPKNKEEAIEFLKFLSGKKQSIITGFAVMNMVNKIEIVDYDETILIFKNLDQKFIEDYVRNNNVTKYAGGYAIQDSDEFIEIIEGDFENIIGAPMKKIVDIVLKLGLGYLLNDEVVRV